MLGKSSLCVLTVITLLGAVPCEAFPPSTVLLGDAGSEPNSFPMTTGQVAAGADTLVGYYSGAFGTPSALAALLRVSSFGSFNSVATWGAKAAPAAPIVPSASAA